MRCYYCVRQDVPCVFEHSMVYEAYMSLGSTRSTHFFFSMEDMVDFVGEQDDLAMFRLFERNLESGEVIEFT